MNKSFQELLKHFPMIYVLIRAVFSDVSFTGQLNTVHITFIT
ncbi:hypothetical protein [Geosporobacter ferrireducens]|nr:hypothetical protein [Geosporobacter ferrireducens]